MAFTIRPLTEATWAPFARLVEANNGIWGGCWCMGMHPKGPGWGVSAEMNRDEKHARVAAGTTQHALVFEGDEVIGWCHYGPPAEIVRFRNRAEYAKVDKPLPDWRIGCFFTGKGHRGKGVAAKALAGALDQIAAAGGGIVEGYPDDTSAQKIANAFLFHGPLSLFEAQGFERDRQIGKTRWVMRRRIEPLSSGPALG